MAQWSSRPPILHRDRPGVAESQAAAGDTPDARMGDNNSVGAILTDADTRSLSNWPAAKRSTNFSYLPASALEQQRLVDWLLRCQSNCAIEIGRTRLQELIGAGSRCCAKRDLSGEARCRNC